ncbi:MAG: type III-A CRISPR-associated RAMP protein Csm5 [Bacteroidales bacterium]|nr:type III-A CRISPR-associated RAMP protein Csm5 [Bacteroidales bacterium]
MKLYLKSLTPIHIGTGEELNRIDYMTLNGMYYRISQDLFLNFIKTHEGMVNRFSQWIDEISSKIEDLEKLKKDADRMRKRDYNQQLSDLRNKLNVWEFIKKERIERSFEEYIDKTDNILKFKYANLPKQQIRGLVKTPDNQFYIPGTSVKGAIRTALLFAALDNEQNEKKINDIITQSLDNCEAEKNEILKKGGKYRSDKFAKTFADSLEHYLCYCSYINEKQQQINQDEKFDVFKFLLVSDAMVSRPSLGLANVDLYLLGRIRNQQRSGFEIKALKQKQPPSIEIYNKGQLFETEIDLNLEYLLNLKEHMINGSIRSGKEQQWIGLKEKLQNVFNLDLDILNKSNLEEQKQKTVAYIFEKVAHFYSLQRDHDKKWLREYDSKQKDRDVNIQAIRQGFDQISEIGKVIHLGYATGFPGTTEFLYLLNRPSLKEVLKDVMEFFEIGKKPGVGQDGKKYSANPDSFPKSRRLATIGDNIDPLGWIQFSLSPFPAIEEPGISDKINTTTSSPPEEMVQAQVPVTRNFSQLKDGDIVDAIVTGQENLYAQVKLFCSDEPDIPGKFRYPAGFEIGAILELKIFFPNKKNKRDFNLRYISTKS